MKRFIAIIILSVSWLGSIAQILDLEPVRRAPRLKELPACITEDFLSGEDRLPLSPEEIQSYLNPLKNTVTYDILRPFNLANRGFSIDAVIETDNGIYLLYSYGSNDVNVVLSDITDSEKYPESLVVYKLEGGCAFIDYTYDKDTNIIEISYHSRLPENGYFKITESYLLKRHFPFLGYRYYLTDTEDNYFQYDSFENIPGWYEMTPYSQYKNAPVDSIVARNAHNIFLNKNINIPEKILRSDFRGKELEPVVVGSRNFSFTKRKEHDSEWIFINTPSNDSLLVYYAESGRVSIDYTLDSSLNTLTIKNLHLNDTPDDNGYYSWYIVEEIYSLLPELRFCGYKEYITDIDSRTVVGLKDITKSHHLPPGYFYTEE